MTRDDIIRMANEAGIIHPEMVDKTLERFAALVAASEREACAKVCDDIRHPWGYSAETPDWERGTEHCANAIRARGQE